MSADKKCTQCLTKDQCDGPLPTFEVILFWVFVAFFVFLMGSFEDVGWWRIFHEPIFAADSKGLLIITGLVIVLILVWIVRRNVLGNYVYPCLDKDGHLHIHETNPWDHASRITEDGKDYDIIGRDTNMRPILAPQQVSNLAFRLCLGGWWNRSQRLGVKSDSGWNVVSAWNGDLVLHSDTDPDTVIRFSIFSTHADLYLNTLRQHPSFIHMDMQLAFGQKNRAFLDKLLDFMVKKLEESKNEEGLGKSKHAQAIRIFLQRVSETGLPNNPAIGDPHVMNTLFGITPFLGLEKEWAQAIGKEVSEKEVPVNAK